jgi:polynucleotide 5'-hydroxyl-kinase GRC3/NOL9
MIVYARVLTPDLVLLVKGPLDISTHGEASILGKDISGHKIFLDDKRVWPIETKSSCDVLLSQDPQKGNEAGEFWTTASRDAGTRIWDDLIYTIFYGRAIAPESVLVVGPTDSGKTTLSTYIINHAIKEGLRPGVIDADIGQGDMAPPCAIGCGVVESQILDLTEVTSNFFGFVGSINPAGYEGLIARSVRLLLNKLTKKNSYGVNLVVINTDGYVAGKGLWGKIAIANKVQPDIIICLGENASDFCLQIKSKIRLEKPPRLLNAKSPGSNNPILKLKTERARRRLNRFQRHIADFGKFGVTKIFSLRKTKFVYNGLMYYKAFVTADNHLLLLHKSKTKKLAHEYVINMFIGLGEASNIVGFGIICFLTNQRIAIQTKVAMADTIYLSNVGINMRTWKPYLIRASKKRAYPRHRTDQTTAYDTDTQK